MEHIFVTELDRLFFEIGQKLAMYKTPAEQQLFLKGLLEKLGKKNDTHLSRNESEETKNQLTRHYKKGFVRWALKQHELITNDSMKENGGKLIWYNEAKKRREEFKLPHNLCSEFQHGWNSAYKKCA
ncbi:MAG TPA: hypothetical protein VJK30_00730 [Coxiellaceae bacterium]|nr:MAG: hypothetical protein A3E81_05210 [Gammaproteobacteria bacterium RIFCSPHIGHO2_12_FULL_36_30]HLB55842.1 hypothetical protein [Coxiellaceae bacterium]